VNDVEKVLKATKSPLQITQEKSKSGVGKIWNYRKITLWTLLLFRMYWVKFGVFVLHGVQNLKTGKL